MGVVSQVTGGLCTTQCVDSTLSKIENVELECWNPKKSMVLLFNLISFSVQSLHCHCVGSKLSE